MIDFATSEAMWDVLHDHVSRQKAGEKVLATEVHAELMEFLAAQEITLPALFEGNLPYQIFDLFVEGGALFVTNNYPEEQDTSHQTHPIFIECSESIDPRILAAYPQLGEFFTNHFCPGHEAAAHAAEVEVEALPAAPDEVLMQNVDIAVGTTTGTGWISAHKAKVGNLLDLGDERAWRVTKVYDGFVLTMDQMDRLPPPGYITDTVH